MKKTDKYILFKVGSGSAIVSAKFKRKKEHEDTIFLSVPETYNFGVKYNEYDEDKKKWVTIRQVDINAEVMKEYLEEDLCYQEEVDIEDYVDAYEDEDEEDKSQGHLDLDLPDDDLPF